MPCTPACPRACWQTPRRAHTAWATPASGAWPGTRARGRCHHHRRHHPQSPWPCPWCWWLWPARVGACQGRCAHVIPAAQVPQKVRLGLRQHANCRSGAVANSQQPGWPNGRAAGGAARQQRRTGERATPWRCSLHAGSMPLAPQTAAALGSRPCVCAWVWRGHALRLRAVPQVEQLHKNNACYPI